MTRSWDPTRPVHAVVGNTVSNRGTIPVTSGNVAITVHHQVGEVNICWTDPLGDNNFLRMEVPEAMTFAGDLIKAIAAAERAQLRGREAKWDA